MTQSNLVQTPPEIVFWWQNYKFYIVNSREASSQRLEGQCCRNDPVSCNVKKSSTDIDKSLGWIERRRVGDWGDWARFGKGWGYIRDGRGGT